MAKTQGLRPIQDRVLWRDLEDVTTRDWLAPGIKGIMPPRNHYEETAVKLGYERASRLYAIFAFALDF